MADDEYTRKMQQVVEALRMAAILTVSLTDDDLAKMERTIESAESFGFLFVAPMEYQRGIERTPRQREALALIRKVRAFFNVAALQAEGEERLAELEREARQ